MASSESGGNKRVPKVAKVCISQSISCTALLPCMFDMHVYQASLVTTTLTLRNIYSLI